MDVLTTAKDYRQMYPHALIGGPMAHTLLAFLAFFAFLYVKSLEGRLPPSPGRAFPIIGHLMVAPKSDPWVTLTKWSRQLGPIFHINLAGQLVVVLGTHKAAADLLDRRSVMYSDRPRNIVPNLFCGGLVFAFISYNEVWKRMRRASHEALNSTISKKYRNNQQTESYLLASQLLEKPEGWDNHLRRAGSSIARSIIYGLPPMLQSTNPDIERVNHFVERATSAAVPGAYWVEYFTWMEHLPRWMDSALFEKLFSDVEMRMHKGDQAGTSIMANIIEKESKFGMSDREAAWCAATLYAAGAETTAGQMAWVVMSMVLYPEVQKKAQAELDRVIGRDRLPSFQDEDNLPFTRAIVREVLRWRGVGPLGIPHKLNQDDVYDCGSKTYYLPKDTIVIANAWAMNHDPDVWGPDADDFNPERHLDSSGQLKPALRDTHDESHVTFGYGRRICVGRHVANASLFIQTACILWAFNFSPCNNGEGVPDPDKFVDNGLIVRPEHFGCAIEPRFESVGEVILQTLESGD
uniref:Putative cytochrome P450 n=1 Tax=Moniliophthora roreri TaxID=221103 RepID=A0A0W0G6X5_MONRR